MPLEITCITIPFMFRMTVNCYLVRGDGGFVLIDTAQVGQRRQVQDALARAKCNQGDLDLIILTHGDFDHCGNAAFLRALFDTKVTMHEADRGMVEQGDMFWNRKQPNVIVRTLSGLVSQLDRADRFTPDFFVEEGDDLSAYGLSAEVIEIPGHSKGSIGLLTADRDLFCGDLLANVGKPALWSIMDDKAAARASVDKLKGREIRRVYPGHGQPFLMEEFLERRQMPASTVPTS